MGDAQEDATSRFLGLAVDGDAAALESMVSSKVVGVDVTESQSGGVTALCVAASRGHRKAVEMLLRLGATPHKVQNKAAVTGNTPLHFAAMGGDVGVLKLLADAGADVRVRNKQEDSVLLHAAVSGKADAVRWLLENGCAEDALGRNKKGVTPLAAATRRAQELHAAGNP
ncbi:ankyrin repeat-containing domain protein [Baffinella frigidus]|nr:ankyrin repeat-containing domain protein [Cryptophyta sp. CCMP2293]